MLCLENCGHDGDMSNDKRPAPDRRDAFDDARGESLMGTTYGGDIAQTREPTGFNLGKKHDVVSTTDGVAEVETAIPALHDPVDDELFSTSGMGTEIADDLMTDASTMELDDLGEA